jgi:hypothetical protein
MKEFGSAAYENEWRHVQAVEAQRPLFPRSGAIRTTQHREREKLFLREQGIACAAFRVVEEMYEQGRLEEQDGFIVAPFMKHPPTETVEFAKLQTSFVEFIVAPLFEAIVAVVPMWWVRVVGGTLYVVGVVIGLINFVMTWRVITSLRAAGYRPAVLSMHNGVTPGGLLVGRARPGLRAAAECLRECDAVRAAPGGGHERGRRPARDPAAQGVPRSDRRSGQGNAAVPARLSRLRRRLPGPAARRYHAVPRVARRRDRAGGGAHGVSAGAPG